MEGKDPVKSKRLTKQIRGHNVRSQVLKMVTDGFHSVSFFLNRGGRPSSMVVEKRQRCRYGCTFDDGKQRSMSVLGRVLSYKLTG